MEADTACSSTRQEGGPLALRRRRRCPARRDGRASQLAPMALRGRDLRLGERQRVGRQEPVEMWPRDESRSTASGSDGGLRPGSNTLPLLMAGHWGREESGEHVVVGHFNGKIGNPSVFRGRWAPASWRRCGGAPRTGRRRLSRGGVGFRQGLFDRPGYGRLFQRMERSGRQHAGARDNGLQLAGLGDRLQAGPGRVCRDLLSRRRPGRRRMGRRLRAHRPGRSPVRRLRRTRPLRRRQGLHSVLRETEAGSVVCTDPVPGADSQLPAYATPTPGATGRTKRCSSASTATGARR